MTITIYRHGCLEPSNYQGEILSYALTADKYCPSGRAPRNGSLYGSPTLKGVLRWTRSNLMMKTHHDFPDTYEITVNPDVLYCYPVKNWEDYSWRDYPPNHYWDHGVPLEQWSEDEHGAPAEWEILFRPEDIISHRRVSKKRILSVLDGYDREEMELILKRHGVR